MAIEQKDSKMTTTHFDYFIESIGENSMMHINAPIICPHNWREYWGDVETEIRTNLIDLSDNIGRVNYLENLLKRLTKELSYCNSDFKEKLNTLYEDNNITEEEIETITGDDKEKEKKRTNFLYVALRKSRRDLLDNGKWVDDYFYPRDCFFGYHLFTILSKAIEFVNERKQEIKSGFNIQGNVPAMPDAAPIKPPKYATFRYVNYATSPQKIKELLDCLIRGKFVEENTSIKDFKPIFRGAELEEPTKVNWVDSISSLHFFISTLIVEKLVEVKHNQHWNICANLFLCKEQSINAGQLNNNKTLGKTTKKILEEAIKILR